MHVDFNMFGSIMLDWIMSNAHCWLVIKVQLRRDINLNSKVIKYDLHPESFTHYKQGLKIQLLHYNEILYPIFCFSRSLDFSKKHIVPKCRFFVNNKSCKFASIYIYRVTVSHFLKNYIRKQETWCKQKTYSHTKQLHIPK